MAQQRGSKLQHVLGVRSALQHMRVVAALLHHGFDSFGSTPSVPSQANEESQQERSATSTCVCWCPAHMGLRSALPGRGWGADGPARGRGRAALSATIARPVARRVAQRGPRTASRECATVWRPG
eukprot:353560-Chlamydomonas_euryale.AAC.1